MKKRGISQEVLKLIACTSMLIDHVGATLVFDLYVDAGQSGLPERMDALFRIYRIMRILRRMAFPIYCFLLAEGVHYTHSPKRYALRLTVGAVLSELPFDLAFFGGWNWGYQNVMLTMLQGFFALEAMGKCRNRLLKLLAAAPFALLAELLKTDYGGAGVLLIVLFGITRELPHRKWLQLAGMVLICGFLIPGFSVAIGPFRIGIELFAMTALLPIFLYDGRKVTSSKAVQWGYYLFYPVHLAALCLITLGN